MSYDLFMLLIVVATVAWGFWKGFIWQLAALASIFSSYGAAYALRAPVAKLIDLEPPLNIFAAMLAVYLLSSVGIWVVFGLISTAINGLQLKDFDRQIGAAFGAAQGGILCVLITFFAVTLSSPAQQQAICQSQSGHYIALLLRNSGGLIPPEMQVVVDPILQPFAAKLDAYQEQDSPPAPSPVDPWQAPPPAAYYEPYPPQYTATPQYNPQPQQYDPRYDAPYDPRYDPRYQAYPDPRYQDPRYPEPRYEDPRYADPRYQDPRYYAPQYDPRYQPQHPLYDEYRRPYNNQPAAPQDDPRYYWR